MTTAAASTPPLRVVDAAHAGAAAGAYLRDCWQHRELVAFLAWRDIRIRYRQTALGVGWAVAQPLMTMAIATLVFARIGNVSTGGVPYAVFALIGLVLWTFFANAVIAASNSLVANQSLVTKVYFPRAVIPAALVTANLLDLLIGLLLVCLLLPWYGIVPGAAVLWLPLSLAVLLLTAIGAAWVVATLSVRFRDLRYIVPFVIQLGLFATPIFYPVAALGHPWGRVMLANPLATSIELARAAIVGGPIDAAGISAGCVMAAAVVVAGVACAQRLDRQLADLL